MRHKISGEETIKCWKYRRVLTIARQLNDTVMGKRITEVETEHTKHGFAWWPPKTPQEYQHIMEGKTVGKPVESAVMVEMTLMNTGSWPGRHEPQILSGGRKLPAKYQMRITFADDSSLLCTVQMYGVTSLFQPETYDNFYYQVKKKTDAVYRCV